MSNDKTCMSSFSLPPDYPRIKRVSSFQELITTPFADGINALCWERTLSGDFAEVVGQLDASEGVATLDESLLVGLSVSQAGLLAIDQLLEDYRLLRNNDLDPVLNCIRDYPRDENPGPVPTDVFSFHADSATVEADTYLCTYHGPASEGLRNEDAQRRVNIPETRAELLKRFGGQDDDAFRKHLKENCFDLHFVPIPSARPFFFGVGNLWRIATDYPGCPVPPCIHRAPATLPGAAPRLLLIS
jgi:hypothetical protein